MIDEATGKDTVGGPMATDTPTAKNANVDALVYLRDFISAKKKVLFHDDWLDFDGHKIHRSAKCGYILHKGAPLIDIGSIWYMYHMTSADRAYNQASAKESKFTYIGIDRRGDLCDFLLGNEPTCQGLVKDVLEGRKRPRERAPRLPAKDSKVNGMASMLGDTISYEDVTKRVRCVQDLDVVIRRPGRLVPNANMILKIAQEEWQAFSTGVKKAAPVSSKSKGAEALHQELEGYLNKDENNIPIILVPANKNAPVNLMNVQDLLQDGKFKRPNDEHKKFWESTRPESVQVKRSMGGKLWTFEVRDSVANFQKNQWLRTVLVITDGNEWQFKGWPFESVVDLFVTMRGVYFRDPGQPLPVHVREWPCQKLMLPTETSQHRWAKLRDDIFIDLEDFMNTSRSKKFSDQSGMGIGRRNVEVCKSIL